MKKVFIKPDSLIARLAARRMGFDRIAIVLGRTIHLYNATVQDFIKNKPWLLHELKHVEQYERGFFRFLVDYLREHRVNGYRNNRFEKEARAAESDIRLLDKYDLSLYMLL